MKQDFLPSLLEIPDVGSMTDSIRDKMLELSIKSRDVIQLVISSFRNLGI